MKCRPLPAAMLLTVVVEAIASATGNGVYLECEAPQRQAAPPATPPSAAPPDTEIYLAPLSRENGRPTVGTATNISNNPGYDNQPFFTPDGRAILFTSARGSSPDLRDGAPARRTSIVTTAPRRRSQGSRRRQRANIRRR